MKKQHLDPVAKRELSLPGAGSIEGGRIAKNAGFDSPARMKFQKTVGDALVCKRADYLLPKP